MNCRCGFIELDSGETCPFCGFVAVAPETQTFYYFSEKLNNWVLCRTESFCKKMAAEGHKVKMVRV